jgi:alanyl-tRNA synthetase
VEELVNEQVRRDLRVTRAVMSPAEAKTQGALGFFAQKYGDRVNVYSIGDFSREICGGPHVERTGQLGSFRIVKEEAVSAGVRRIRAVVA